MMEPMPVFVKIDEYNEVLNLVKLVRKKLEEANNNLFSGNAFVDQSKLRIIADAKYLKGKKEALRKNMMVAAIVEEYPTYDGFIVELEYI